MRSVRCATSGCAAASSNPKPEIGKINKLPFRAACLLFILRRSSFGTADVVHPFHGRAGVGRLVSVSGQVVFHLFAVGFFVEAPVCQQAVRRRVYIAHVVLQVVAVESLGPYAGFADVTLQLAAVVARIGDAERVVLIYLREVQRSLVGCRPSRRVRRRCRCSPSCSDRRIRPPHASTC